MKIKHWLSAAAGVLALGALSVAAEAAPLGSTAGGLKATANGENALTQQATYGRRCWRHRGHWHCRRGYRRYYRNYYYSDPYYYGPGFSLYFGGGHRHGHRHRHHRHW
jgi:hypothetical protein